uniref:hypothetical protein n=1 Tax=Sphingomonas sp. TaxID=28214 RepID=UPI003569FE81
MAEPDMRRRADRVDARFGGPVSLPGVARLHAVGEQLNASPRIVAQRHLSTALNRAAANGGTVVQRVYTYKNEKVSGGNAPAKRLPHGVGAKDAARLSRAERDFGTLASTADFTAAIGSLLPGEGAEVDLAAVARAAALKPYMDLLPHLAGEEDGTEGKGGHLLTAMQAKWTTRLHVTGEQEAAGIWEAEWNLLKDPAKEASGTNLSFTTAKASTMFPAAWSQADLVGELNGSNQVVGGRELQPSGIKVKKSGDTFYPVW